jgi:flagellar basal-body rod modification protein FlgD
MSMSTIDSVSSFETLQAQPQTYGNSDLGQDAFLQLLVTQLQQQDPLDPQDNEEFVAQLAQFSSLEQLTTANSALESLYLAMSSMNNASMTQLLGKNVRAYGDAFHYGGNGDVELHYEVPSDFTGTLTVTDDAGRVVHTAELGTLSAGDGSYTWDGSSISGTADSGTYTFSISGKDANGDPVEVATMVEGEIDGMSFETGSPEPSIAGVPLSLADIVYVSTADAAEEDPDA